MTPDLKTRFDRLADRTTPRDGDAALERLRDLRARRVRARRITAGSLALVVAVAGTAVAIAAFGRDPDSTRSVDQPTPTVVPTWATSDVLTIWPENPVRSHVTDPGMIQRSVDRGDEQLRWRLDPEEVGRRFAHIVLGWNAVTLVGLDIENDAGALAFEITPCPPNVVCDVEGPPLTIWLRQPATTGETGIWSVVQVTSPALDITVPDALVLEGGTPIRFDLELPAYRAVHLGLAASNGCRTVTELEPGNDAGSSTLRVPAPMADDGSGCAPTGAGYVFAYTQDDTTVPVGDPLLEAAAIESPYLTMIPVVLEMGTGSVPEESPSAPPSAALAGMDVHEAVIRHLLGMERADWETIYIRETLCENAGTGSMPRGCVTAFSPEERTLLTQRLVDVGSVEFVSGLDEVPNAFEGSSVFIWLGPLEPHGDGYGVPGSMVCGGLCGSGSVWDVRERGDRWTVVGSAEGVGIWVA